MIVRSVVATCLSLISTVTAQSVLAESSFGHAGNLAPDGQKIPGWTLSTSGHNPHILSDRVALSTLYPPNTKGALWAEQNVNTEQWTVELEFRASGGDHAEGSIALWYVQNKEAVEQHSIYSVGKFDGLALVVDQYGGRGGSVRGFLNDGSQSFNTLTNLDSLAFGHCDYKFYNLGRPSKLRVSNHNGLSVYVDDQLCFSSDQITIPGRYRFGISAHASEHPDTFEVFKFTVIPGAVSSSGESQQHQQQPQQQPQPRAEQNHGQGGLPGAPEALPDRVADEIKSNDAQFADLHNRLQSLQHQLADMHTQFNALSQKLDSKAGEILTGMPNIPEHALNALSTRVQNTERIVLAIQRDVEGRDYNHHFNELSEAMANVRGGLSPESLGKSEYCDRLVLCLTNIATVVTASAPRMGFFLFVVIAVQIFLAGAYVLYKRRRANAPKKYL